MDDKSIPVKEDTNLVIVQDESGVALLMSLGVLSLLIVLSLAFAVRTMNSMKGVQLSQDLVKVRLYDETGFQKVYALLSGEFADPNDEDNLFPATKDNQAQFYEDYSGTLDIGACWYSVGLNGQKDDVGVDTALYMTIAGKDYTPDDISSLTAGEADDNKVSWYHILDTATQYPNNDTPIAARISFVIVDESGKIDPWAVQEPGAVAEGSEIRLGQDVGEISLKNIVTDALANKLVYTAGDPKWYSYYNIYKLNTFDNTEADDIRKHLFPHSYDIEAFSTPESGAMVNKHRFNVGTRDDANWWDNLADPKIDTILQDASDFDDTNTGGIPWLYNAYTDVGTDSDLWNQIGQVAANIVDYCDTNSLATYNLADASIPVFCGNEKVPYINEIKFTATLAGGQLSVTADVELVNVYDIDLGAGGDITISIDVLDDTTVLHSSSTTSSGIADVPTQSYSTIAGINLTGGTIAVTPPLNDFTIQINSIELTDGNAGPDNVWDLALDEALDGLNTAVLDNGDTMYVSAEVNDPRHNLDKDEWTWAVDTDADSINDSPASWVTVSNQAGTIGLMNLASELLNAAVATPADVDTETGATEPWQISTNFIRNGPMESLWELGAIHRGAAWQTLNFKTSNIVSAGQLDEAVFGDYNDGDAYMLSQVKLNSDTEVIGRVNINTYNSTVLKALFKAIKVGYDYENNDTGNSIELTDAHATTLTTATLQDNGTTAGRPFLFRGEIAKVGELSDFSGILADLRDTDREKEEIIGKMVALTTVRSNYFTAIITSQIVKDMIDGYKGGSRGTFDNGIDEVLAEQRLMTVLYRDALTNEFEVIRYEYLDQ